MSEFAAFVCVLGMLGLMACQIWLLVIIYRESGFAFVLSLLIPFVAIYFAWTNWEICKKPFLCQMGCLAWFFITSFVARQLGWLH